MKQAERNVLACGITGLLVAMGAALPTQAQEAVVSGQFELPYGMGFGEESRAYEPGTRDSAGNRVIVDGRILNGDSTSTLGMGMNTHWGQTSGRGMIGQNQAIGNQLNVITNGNYNTIIIDNTQINNGDQTAILNGELDLND